MASSDQASSPCLLPCWCSGSQLIVYLGTAISLLACAPLLQSWEVNHRPQVNPPSSFSNDSVPAISCLIPKAWSSFHIPQATLVTWGGLNSSAACCFFHETSVLNVEDLCYVLEILRMKSQSRTIGDFGEVLEEMEEQVQVLESQKENFFTWSFPKESWKRTEVSGVHLFITLWDAFTVLQSSISLNFWEISPVCIQMFVKDDMDPLLGGQVADTKGLPLSSGSSFLNFFPLFFSFQHRHYFLLTLLCDL